MTLRRHKPETTDAPVKPEAIVTRDSKTVGVETQILYPNKTFQFPLGTTWRWHNILPGCFLEVLQNEQVIFQAPAGHVAYVTGPCCTQPVWRSVEYPA